MSGRVLGTAAAVLAILAVSFAATPAAADPCSQLAANAALGALPNTRITLAVTSSGTLAPADGGPELRDLPSFCRVAATLAPTPVSDIRIEVWMPTDGWNGMLEGVGNGGLAGTISYAALATAIRRGYAAVSTDTGHVAGDPKWLPVEQRERDYGYRSIHEMTITAKAVLRQFYRRAATRAYFNGCSTGGGQGLAEAQLYPDDYDGIVAGAPQNFPAALRAAHIWDFQATHKTPDSSLPKQALALVTAAVLKKCGGPFGPADGFLSGDPRSCRFDPRQLLCRSGEEAGTCLSAAQVRAILEIYQGPVDPRTGKQIWPGFVRGSEHPAGSGPVGWDVFGLNGMRPFSPASQFYALAVFQNPDLDFRTVDVASAAALAEKKFPFLNHLSTNIQQFTSRGGKLLIYHGWADPGISPLNTINYYGGLVRTTGRARHLGSSAALEETQKSVRLFMVPGMGHCAGGPGPDQFDALGALDLWVRNGTPPDRIVASHWNNHERMFSRPLCPYPQQAQYTGSGDRDDARNWVCVARPFVADPAFY